MLAQATPGRFGDPIITDETLEPLDTAIIARGDIVGIGIHTGNALRGYEIGVEARAAGAIVVFGGIHATSRGLAGCGKSQQPELGSEKSELKTTESGRISSSF